MELNVSVGPESRRTFDLVDEVQRMIRSNAHDDATIKTRLIGGLVNIVAQLEASIAETDRAAAEAKRQNTFDELNFRQYDR
ncbi:MAG: hypothetical protein ACRDUX_10660 [Mycobacterium sp.]